MVVNDVDCRKLGHNLSKAYEKHSAKFGDLSIRTFRKPAKLREDLWFDETPARFIDRVEDQGRPDSRYGLVSWHSHASDLFKLDQLAMAFRRLSIGMTWTVGADWTADRYERRHIGNTYEQVLRKVPKFQPRWKIPGIDGASDVCGPKLEDTLFAWNFELRRSRHDIERSPPPSVTSSFELENSYVYLVCEELLDPNTKPEFLAGVEWLLRHVALGHATAHVQSRLDHLRTSSHT